MSKKTKFYDVTWYIGHGTSTRTQTMLSVETSSKSAAISDSAPQLDLFPGDWIDSVDALRVRP